MDEAATDAAAADSYPYMYMSPFYATIKWGSDKISYLSKKANITLKLIYIFKEIWYITVS